MHDETTTSMMKRLHRRAVACLAILSFGALTSCSDEPEKSLVGYSLKPPTSVGALTLPDAVSGAPVAFRPQPGHVMVAYFGYTSCPDVCPTTLADLKAALNRLGADRAGRVEVAMVTIDPKRDTGQLLQDYLRSFVPSATALRTEDDAALRKVTDTFGAQYSVTGTGDNIEVAHSGSMYVIDPAGDVVDVLSFPTPAADIENDLAILIDKV